MKICSLCGAENLDDLQSCRMCLHSLSTPLEEVPTLAEDLPDFAGTIIEHSHRPAEIECHACSTLNEAGFNFCLKCGTPLVKDTLLDNFSTPLISKLTQGPTYAMPKAELSPLPPSPHDPNKDDPVQYQTTPATGVIRPCPNCNREILTGSRFCHLCGVSLDEAPPPAPPTYQLRLIVDGEESDEIYLLKDAIVIGRVQGDIHFPYDDFMSSRHASLVRQGNRFLLKDEGSRNGTFLMLEGETELKPGDVFMVGKQLFKFEVQE